MSNPTASADVAAATNIDQAVSAEGMTGTSVRGEDGLVGNTTEPGGAEHVASPTALGLDSTGWVAVAALVVLVIMLWQKVPGMIGRMLDTRIAAIRTQLDEAKALRAEAEALKAEYEARAATAHAEAATMRAHAQAEAASILSKAKVDAEQLMDRRAKMAEDKIAAAERTAIAEVRARAAESAVKAAAALIAEHHGADADRAMVDRSISGLSRAH